MDEGDVIHYRTCPLCEATCGLEIAFQDDSVRRIRGDSEDVFSRGFICPKGSALKGLHEDPDRLRTPLVRVDGELRPATWPEAFAAVAEGLGHIWGRGNRDAVGLYLGNPNVHTVAGGLYLVPLIKAIRTRNVFSASTVDQMPKHVSSGYLFGNPNTIPVVDIDRTDYLLMLGANPLESNGSMTTAPDFPGRMEAIRSRGGKIVTVDPRRTKTAMASDEHLAIRPGTDGLWLAALVSEIATSGQINLGDIAEHVDGLHTVINALAAFTPASVASHTHIPPEVTSRIANELIAAPSAAVYGRIGTHTTPYGTLASWLAEVLNIITGNLDRPGGMMFPRPAISSPTERRPPGGAGWTTGRWASRVGHHPEVKGEFPVAAMSEEILTPGDGQVLAMVTIGGNPLRSCPASDRLEHAFSSLEFMVSVDIYLNETTRHADVILPPPSPLAKPHYDFAFLSLAVRNVAKYSPPHHRADHPSEPGMDETEILARLALIASGLGPDAEPTVIDDLLIAGVAQRCGVSPDQAAAQTSHLPPVEAALDLMLRHGPYDGLDIETLRAAPHGIDLGALQPRIPEVLRTASGRIELAAEPLIHDVSRLAAVLDSPPDESVLLVGRRHLRSNNSWMHNINVLVKGKPRCTLQVNPADAARLDLTDGSTAQVESETGRVHALVEITDEVMVGTVSLPHGWGHGVHATRGAVAAATVGVNSNQLTSDRITDPLSGNAQLNALAVRITKEVAP